MLKRRVEHFGGRVLSKATEVALMGTIHKSKTFTNLKVLENSILFH